MKQEPIPITPELLEKNGFKKTKFKYLTYWLYCDDYYSLYVEEFNDGLFTVEHHSEELINYTDRIHISYVHELQTFLDLCGVDKRIVL